MSVRIQFRRGTAAAATTDNPTLAAGEPGFESDTAKLKIGDGATAWNSLPYVSGGTGAVASVAGRTGAVVLSSADLSDVASLVKTKPYQFHVSAYGAMGDCKTVTDGAMTSASHTLTSATAGFTSGDVGKPIVVSGAGGGTYTPLATTISAFTNSTTVTLTAAASSTVTSAITAYGTDDTAAIDAAVNAAVAYAQTHDGYCEVLHDNLAYAIGGAPVTGGTTHGNAQIPLPVIAPTALKVTLVIRGVGNANALPHWLETTVQLSSSAWVCLRNDGSSGTADGPTSVLGGPFNGYGAGTSLFNNMLIVIDGVRIMAPYNGTYSGMDFYGMAEASVPNYGYGALAVVPTGGPVPSMATPTNITNFGYFALRMPSTNNNALADIGYLSIEGAVNGLRASEHTTVVSARIINCYTGLVCYVGTSGDMPHSMYFAYLCIENVQNVISNLSPETGLIRLFVAMLDVESVGNSIVNDAGTLFGTVNLNAYALGVSVVAGTTGIKVVSMRQATGNVTAPTFPTTGVAVLNPFNRDASVTLSGGTITAVAVDGVASGLSGACTVLVPSGKSITPTFTGGAGWKWTLI